ILGYSLEDLKGISPTLCTHRIPLDPAFTPSREPQRRLNNAMREIVKKEVLKLLDGYFGYHQIPIHPDDQSKTTFICPYGTYAYRRMSFGLCNAPTSFQRCMMAIFLDLIEHIMEVFMDNFSVYGKDLDQCLENLEKVLKRCQETHLVLNWEKCHFMVREGI